MELKNNIAPFLLVFILLVGSTMANAQVCSPPPEGSYQDTCSSIKSYLNKNHCDLEASCPTYKDKSKSSKLENYESCPYDVSNCDGKLTCGDCCHQDFSCTSDNDCSGYYKCVNGCCERK